MAYNEKTRRPRPPREEEAEMTTAPKRPMPEKGRGYKNRKMQEGGRRTERTTFDPHAPLASDTQPRANRGGRSAAVPKTEQVVPNEGQAAKAMQNALPPMKERPTNATRPNRNGTAAAGQQGKRPQNAAQGKFNVSSSASAQQKPVANPRTPTTRPTQAKSAQNDSVCASAVRRTEVVSPMRPSPRPVRENRNNRGMGEENPGLLLISRRPPAQKFSNFEEYINAHGGVTVPVEEREDEG